MVIGDIVHSSS